MVARDDYRVIAKDRGTLALELYALESKPEKSPDGTKQYPPAYLDYEQDPEERGLLVLTGPHSDATGYSPEGAGLIAYRAGSMAKARQLADADPIHPSGPRQPVTQVAGQKGRYLVERWHVRDRVKLDGDVTE